MTFVDCLISALMLTAFAMLYRVIGDWMFWNAPEWVYTLYRLIPVVLILSCVLFVIFKE